MLQAIPFLVLIRTGGSQTLIYEVKPGDALWKIAHEYETTVEDLKLYNGLQSDLILVGQKLKVPFSYTVVAGDSLWKLSNTYHTTVQSIKDANGLKSNVLYIGQKLRIPPKKLSMQGEFVLMTRDDFKEWILNHKFMRNVTFFQEHHTYDPSYDNFNGSNYFSLLEGMKRYHVQTMGWNDISQNITTFPDGMLAVCRTFNNPPQGSFGLLNKSVTPAIEATALAIENVGDFDSGHDQMTETQKDTIVTVAALLCLKFGLEPSVNSITYHHWWDIHTGELVFDNSEGHAVKTCPGTNFFGGNTTTIAKTHFYPLVKSKMQEISATLSF